MSSFRLFWLFFKIGLFTIGGGYAMIPIIQDEVVEKQELLTTTEFVDALAISQASPGAIAINLSVFLGYRIKGVKGAVLAVLGSALPSYIIILLVSSIFFKYRNLPAVESVFTGIRIAVVAMIGVSLVSLIKTVKMNKFGYAIFVIAGILLILLNWNPIIVLILGALSAIVFDRFEGGI
ncbi:MAG: chromate transporter [Andreesenia angusta]|nr:chromate transporter [Andreesenia angusta]